MEIRGVIDMARYENEWKFRSRLQLQMDIAPVRANCTHVQKVLLNLLHNSIEATQDAGVPSPSVTMTVRTTENGGFTQATIQDNGPGINKEDLQRLFEPFFTTKGKGMGIGLAVCHSLIETNGGQLWVDPEQSPGAAFHFTLTHGNMSNSIVYIVDDDAAVLETAGYTGATFQVVSGFAAVFLSPAFCNARSFGLAIVHK